MDTQKVIKLCGSCLSAPL